jgi:hypothetical protein
VQVDVEVGGGPEALDQRHSAAVTIVGVELGGVEQAARDHTLHHLQRRCDQFGLGSQQHAQQDRQGQHPLPHWQMRDDVIHRVCRCLRHPARTA